MDYKIWGQQYLEEAEAISARIRRMRTEDAEMTLDRARQLGMLYNMYLECRVTGRQLLQRAERHGNAR